MRSAPKIYHPGVPHVEDLLSNPAPIVELPKMVRCLVVPTNCACQQASVLPLKQCLPATVGTGDLMHASSIIGIISIMTGQKPLPQHVCHACGIVVMPGLFIGCLVEVQDT